MDEGPVATKPSGQDDSQDPTAGAAEALVDNYVETIPATQIQFEMNGPLYRFINH